MTATNLETRVLNLLEANTALAAVVGTSIYWPYFPAKPVLPGIAFEIVSGTGSAAQPMRQFTIEAHCYAATPLAARNLYELMRRAMIGLLSAPQAHQDTLRTYGIVSVLEEQEGQPGIDPIGNDKGTPYVVAFFAVTVADE